MEVGIRDLKNNLSRHLERVKAGETVTVTDRGKPVAKIEPVHELTNFERLLAEGRITPASRPKRPISEHPRPDNAPLPPGTIRDLVDEGRGPH